MGANHFSQTVFGVDPEQTRELVVRWLRAKGYELQEGAPLTTLDQAHERGVQLAWRGDTTVILFSHLQEQPRLVFELKKLGGYVLDYWMHDSDIWGYQMWERNKCIDAFHSNPAYFGGFEDIEGPRDVPALCEAVGLAGQASSIAKLQKKKSAIFAESVSSKFVKALGAAPAASQYSYTASMPWPGKGFESERLWFRKVAWDPMKRFNVDQMRFEVLDPSTAWQADMSDEEKADVAQQMKSAQRMVTVLGWLLWPLQQLMRPWIWWQMRKLKSNMDAAEATDAAPPAPDWSDYERAFEVEGGRLVSQNHRCSITLPDGAEVQEMDQIRMQPATVFGFTVGETRVQCTATLPSAVQAMTRFGPAGSSIEEERFESEQGTVRWVEVEWEMPPHPQQETPLPMWRMMAFVAGPQAVYQFSAMEKAPVSPALKAACRAAIESLRFEK